jgi:hypothetical protein
MSFTVDDFQDLIRLLGERPEWRAELRRHVLSDELLELPALVRGIAEQLAALTARVDQLAEAQARTEQQLATLARRMDQLVEAEIRSENRLADLEADTAWFKGLLLERRFGDRAPAYFAPLARRVRVVDFTTLADLLDDAVEAGRLTDDERHAVLEANLVLSGRCREDGAAIYLLVEVSLGIGVHDVERAAERAALLARLDRPAAPVVAGAWITRDARTLSEQSGVRQILDGRLERPVARP